MSTTIDSGDVRSRAAKSPDAFRTISEVAADLDVPQHVLRFWETKFSQIRPLKRGGGRRYYRPEDVDLLRRIRTLLYGEGYTIKGVQKVLREGGRSAGDAVAAVSVPLSGTRPTNPIPMPPRSALTSRPMKLTRLSRPRRRSRSRSARRSVSGLPISRTNCWS